jgi:hypothetical protein
MSKGSRGRKTTLMWLAMAGACVLASWGIVQAGGKPKPPPPAVDTGMIYYTSQGAIWSMLPDGSQKTDLVPLMAERPDASAAVHDGCRWFIGTMKVASDHYYVDGHPRIEVVAQSDDGRVIQLTDVSDPYTQVIGAQWATHNGLADGKASFVKLHAWWNEQGWWNWEVGGLYVIEIGWTETGEPVALTEPAEVLPVIAVPSGPYGWSYDWSPDGEHLVRQSGETIFIDDSTTPLCSGWGVKWSPVRPDGGTLVAFGVGIWGNEIHTIRPDGTGEATIVSVSNQQSVDSVIWSPHGTYLVYDASKYAKIGISKPTHDTYRAAATGGSSTNLTGDISGGAGPIGWRE